MISKNPFNNNNSSTMATINGVNFPIQLWNAQQQGCPASGSLSILIGHGLGARNPKNKHYWNDDWTNVIAGSAIQCNDCIDSIVAYTARGHGDNTGWETNAEVDLGQFSWSRLAIDMIEIANSQNISRFIAAGSSMGAATSLYAAIREPARVVGVILLRPPTAWESRKERSKYIASSAKKCQESHPTEKHHFVLRGAGLTDLPPIDDPVYSQITCPVLILTIEGDETHPLSTALQLEKLLCNSVLSVAPSDKEAAENWPALIRDFIQRIAIANDTTDRR